MLEGKDIFESLRGEKPSISSEYKWRVLYKPPFEEMIDDDPDTWRKVFYISKYECKEELDLELKVLDLKNLYNMKKEYIIIENLEEGYFV